MGQTAREVAVVTGATGGIGRWIALGLARAGHHVILVCRDRARGNDLIGWIAQNAPASSTELRLADLSSLCATRRLGDGIAAAHPRISLVVNNAGIFTARRQTTAEGREIVLAVNHLAPFVLTDALEASLRAGAPSRIINVGSSTSDHARINPDDLELTERWEMVRAYGRSKLALMMSTFSRAERLRGSGVVANVVHPGMVATALIREKGAIGACVAANGAILAHRRGRCGHAIARGSGAGVGRDYGRLCQGSHRGSPEPTCAGPLVERSTLPRGRWSHGPSRRSCRISL